MPSKQQERKSVVELRLKGFTYKEIQKKTGHYKNYVKRWVERWNKNGSLNDAPHLGAQSKFSTTFKKKVINTIKSKEGSSRRKVAK